MSIATTVAALAPARADPALLEPAADRAITQLLERNFTLPLSLAGAARTAEERQALVAAEVARLTAVLVARGYREARIETWGRATEDDPVHLRPVPGPLYRFAGIRILGLPAQMDHELSEAVEALQSGRIGTPLLGSAVDDLTRGLLYALRQASYGDAALGNVAFELDRQTGGATLVVTVEAGMPLRFGAVRFLGSMRMTDEEGQALVPFRAGDPYSVTAIEALHRALYERDMFRRIRVETVADPERPGIVDLAVRLRDKADLPPVASQPWLLLSTILFLAALQTLRMTGAWSNTGLRRLMIGAACLLLAGSAVEVAQRLYSFLTQ